jgi:hypothetical protein
VFLEAVADRLAACSPGTRGPGVANQITIQTFYCGIGAASFQERPRSRSVEKRGPSARSAPGPEEAVRYRSYLQQISVCKLGCCNKGRTQHLADLTSGIAGLGQQLSSGRLSPIRGIILN